MSTIQPIYTWSTPQGTLDLLPSKKGYAFCLTTNTQTKVQIPVTQSHNCLFSESQKVETVCKNYFPTLNQNQRREWTVTFNLDLQENTALLDKCNVAFNFSFNSLDTIKQIQFSKTGPTYCQVVSGLNMQGECTNKKCIAIGKAVLIQKGMGSFNVAQLKHTSTCPACNEEIPFNKMNNLGFWYCKYEIAGQRADQAKKFLKTEVAKKEHYTTFTPGEDCAWEYLQVTTTPL